MTFSGMSYWRYIRHNWEGGLTPRTGICICIWQGSSSIRLRGRFVLMSSDICMEMCLELIVEKTFHLVDSAYVHTAICVIVFYYDIAF